MKFKTIIVEDQLANLETLMLIFDNYCPNVEVVATARSVSEGYKAIKEHKVDLVFFDIDILEGTSFDILKKLEKENAINFKFIFLTAHSNAAYTIKALKYAATDYLVKPVESQAVVESIENLISKNKQQYSLLLNLLETPFNQSHEIVINGINNLFQVCKVSDILYFDTYNGMTQFHLNNKTTLIGSKNIGRYADDLCNDFFFMRIDQSCVINLNHLLNYQHAELRVKLKNGVELKASRQGGKLLKNYLKAENPKALKTNFLIDFINKFRA